MLSVMILRCECGHEVESIDDLCVHTRTHHARMPLRQERTPVQVEERVHYQARGERHGMSKLSECAVRSIREDRKSGVPIRQVAARYHVSISVVSDITHGKLWAHVV